MKKSAKLTKKHLAKQRRRSRLYRIRHRGEPSAVTSYIRQSLCEPGYLSRSITRIWQPGEVVCNDGVQTRELPRESPTVNVYGELLE